VPEASSPLNCFGGNAAVFGLLLIVISPALGQAAFNKKEEK
jgi:hypothetical protein